MGIAQKTGSNLLQLGGKGVKRVADMIHGVQPDAEPEEEPVS